MAELHSDQEQSKQKVFDQLVKRRWDTSINVPNTNILKYENEFEGYEDEDEEPWIVDDIEDAVDSTGNLINQKPICDQLLNMQVSMQSGNVVLKGKVIRRWISPNRQVAGTYDDNLFVNLKVYKIEFSDGQVK